LQMDNHVDSQWMFLSSIAVFSRGKKPKAQVV